VAEREAVRLRPFGAVFITACAWAGVLAGVPALVLLLVGRADDELLYWGAIGSTAALAFLLAVLRVRLEVDSEEIRVFNVRRSYRVAWDSVVRIDVVAWWLSPSVVIVGSAAVRVVTRYGERVVIDASTCEPSKVLGTLAEFSGAGVEIRPG
jgi:hypothetical protein